MKKRLLLCAVAALTALSSFALGSGEFVYTRDGRYKTLGANLSQVDLTNFNGFVAVPAGSNEYEGTVDWSLLFSKGNDADAGLDYIQATSALGNAAGVAYKLPTEGASTLLVSLKLKAATYTGIYNTVCGHVAASGKNLIRVVSVAKGADVQTADIVAYYGTPLTVNPEWTTVAFPINEVDADSYDYYLEIFGASTDMQIADISVNAALQVADLRQKDIWVKKATAYLNADNWTQDVLDETGLAENLESLEDIDDEASQTDLADVIEGVQESIYGAEGIVKHMDNWLGTGYQNTLGTSIAKTQKATNWGIWTFQEGGGASGRLFGEAVGNYMEGPHGAGNYGMQTTGLQTTEFQEFPAGNYVFSVEMNGVRRMQRTGSCWDVDEAYTLWAGQLYVLDEAGDTIYKTDTYDLPTGTNAPDSRYASNTLTWKLDKGGKYKVGMYAAIKDGYTANQGGTVTFKEATLYFVSNEQYTKAQLDYISDVKEQITTGRTQITTANENIANAEKLWGKTPVQECLDTVTSKITAYEALDTTAILATYYDDYTKTTSAENGYLVYEVYQQAVKDIIAANRAFNAKNDTLASLQTAIDNAKALLGVRIYSNSSNKEQFEQEIAKAENLLASLKQTDYSRENAQAILDENAALISSGENFKNGLPVSAITTVVDIDFEKAPKLDEGNDYDTTPGAAEIEGNVGSMSFTNFVTTSPSDKTIPFEIGVDYNGEKLLPGVLRVGNGDALVNFNTGEMGSNILRVSMDWWFMRLANRYVGFYLLDENGEKVSGLFFNPYQQATDGLYDPCGIQNGQEYYVATTSDNQGSCVDANKTQVELLLDYGTKKAQLTTITPKGSYSTDWVAFSGAIANTFKLTSGYRDYPGRRCWFDNLKIEVITAGEPDPDAVAEVKAADAEVKAAAKKIVNGKLVIETANGTYNAAGAQVK